jgi:hypothetical protein
VVKGSEWGKNANSKAVDIAPIVVYNDKQKVENMRLLAKNGDNIRIYDAGDNWFHQKLTPGQEKEFYIPKTEKKMYPLAACAKWGFEAVDNGYLDALWKGGLKGVEEYLKTHP